MPSQPPQSKNLSVSPAEDGSKLLRFLERHIEASKAELHKWLRTGQIRLNGKRTKPFVRLESDDIVRIPPFAIVTPPPAPVSAAAVKPLPIIAETESYLIIDKPAGLAVQGGSHTPDSVANRMQQIYSSHPVTPAPAHRLDKATSGLLLIGKTHRALQNFSQLFATPGTIGKEYLAIVKGRWQYNHPTLLIDTIQVQRDEKSSKEQMACDPNKAQQIALTKEYPAFSAGSAACIVQPLAFFHNDYLTTSSSIMLCDCSKTSLNSDHLTTLLWIQLITGKKHQIRIQLASRGYPIVGDRKYGSPGPLMYLHSFGLTIDNQRFFSWPAWSAPWEKLIHHTTPPLFAETPD